MDRRAGYVALIVSGKGAAAAFSGESGGHRWQRIPPTEKRGRVQTSTVTVAVLPAPTAQSFEVKESDLEWSFCRGSGAGGQHRNKTDSAVILRHVPTGMTVRCESERSQTRNKASALSLLRARLAAADQEASASSTAASRKSQVGAGCRGDKAFTHRTQDDTTTEHVSGRKMPLSKFLRGESFDIS